MSAPSTSASAESSNTNTTTGGITKRRIAPLLARRKQNLARDEHIAEDKYTHTDTDGDKIHRVKHDDSETGDKTVDINISVLLAANPSTTSNHEVLRIEAEQASEASDEELERMNPHISSNDDVLDTVTDANESDERLLLLREYYPRENGGDHEKPPEIDKTTRGRRGGVAAAVAVAVVVVVRWYCNMLTIRACLDVTRSYGEHVSGILFDSRQIAAGGDYL